MTAIPLQRDDVYYPESDGKPMGETEIHVEETIYLIVALKDRFRDEQDVYVGGDMFLYYVEGDPKKVVAPGRFRRAGRSEAQAADLQALGRGSAADLDRRGHIGRYA